MSSSTSDLDSISTQQNGPMHHGTFLDFKLKRKKWTCDENTESASKQVPVHVNKPQDVTEQGKPFVTSKSGQGQDVTQQGKPFVTSKSDQDDDSGIYSDSSSSLFRGSENSMNSPSGTPGHSTPCSEDGSTAGSTSARFGMLRKSNLEVMQEVAEDCDICSKEREDEFIREENQNKEYSGDKPRENEDQFSDYDEEKAMVIVESDDDDRSSIDSVKLNSSYANQRHENSWKDDSYENNRKSPVEMTNGETASSYGQDEAKRQEDVSRVRSTTQQEVSRTDYCSLQNTYTSNTFSTASSYSSRNTYEGRESSTSLTTQSQLASCSSVSNDEMMRNYVSSLQSHGPKFTLKLQTTEGVQDVVFPVLGSFPHQRGYGVGTAALADQQKNSEHEVIDLSMDSAEDKVSHDEDHHQNSEATDQHCQQEEQYARDNNVNSSENAPRLSDNPQNTMDNSQTLPPPTTSTTGDNTGNNPYYHPSNTATPLMSWAQFSKAAGINLENMSKEGMNPLIQGFGLSGMSLMRGKLPNVADGALENGDSAKVSLPNMDPNLTVTDWDYLSQVQEAQKEQIKDSKKKGEASEEDPGMQCEICGDKATGLHYGVISCEGCKGFFKRTVQNRRVYVCIGTGECEVNKLQRNRCQFCRFKKCLKKGMIMAAVREDRMPGGRNSGAVYKLRKMKYRKQNDKLKSGALSQTSCTSDSQDSDYQRESLSHYRHLTVTQANQLLYRQNSGQSDYSTSKSTLSESSTASVSNNDPRSFPSPVKHPVSENLAVSSKYTAVIKSGERPLYSPYPKSNPGKALQGNPPQSYASQKMASPSQQKSPIIDKVMMEGGRPKLRFACPNPGEATVTNRQDYGVSHDLKGTVSQGLASPREDTNHRATEYLVPKLEKNAPSNGNESSVSMVTNTSTSTAHPANLGYSFPYHPTFSSQALASYMQTYPVSCLPLAGVSSSPSRHSFEHKTLLPPFDDDLPMDMRSHLIGKSIKPHFTSSDHGKSHEQPSKPYDYSARSHAYNAHVHPMRSPYHHRLSDSSARSRDLQEMSLEQQNVIRSATHYMETESGHSSKNSDSHSSVRDIHTVPHPLHMATSSYNNNSSHDHRSPDSQPVLAIPTPRLSGFNQHNTLLQAKTHSEMMSSYYNLLDELSRKGKLLSPSGVENSSYELMKLNQSRMATARQETESYEKSNPSPPSKEKEQLGNHQLSHGKEKAEVTKQSTLLYRRWSSQCQETSATPGEDGKQSPRRPSVSGKGGFEMKPCGPRATSDAPNAVTERRVSTGSEQPNRASHEEQNSSVMEQSDQETVSKQRVRNRTDSESRVTSDEDESGNQTNYRREETESSGCRSNASSPASVSDSRSEVLLIQQLMNWEDFKNGLTKQQLRDSDDYQSIADIYSRLGDEIMCEIIRWMQKLPFYGLVSLASHTQALQKHWHHVLLLATSVNQAWGQMEKRPGTSAADSQCLLVNNLQKLHAVLTSRLKRSIQFNELFNQSGKMVEKVTRLVCEFAKLHITKEEYVCLKVFMLLTSDNRVSQKIRNYYEVALKKLLQERFPMEEDRFNTLIHLKRAVEDCGDFLMEEQMIHIPFILN